MKKHLSLLPVLCGLCALLALAGCNHGGYTIEGMVENSPVSTLWLEEIAPEGHLFVDSIPLDSKGRFSYQGKELAYRTLYNLHVGNFVITTLPDNGEHLKLDIQASPRELTYQIEGSPESALLWQLQSFGDDGSRKLYTLVDTMVRYDSLLSFGAISQEAYDLKKEVCDATYRDIFTEQQDFVCSFIEEHPGSLAALIALYKPFNNYPLIDPRTPVSLQYSELILQNLEQTLPNNPHTLHFRNSIEQQRQAQQQ